MFDLCRRASLLVLAAALAGCQSASTDTVSATESGYAAEIPGLTCAAFGASQGRAARLTAKRVRAGDPAYIEFRQRPTISIPTGHIYVVFGRLNRRGEPVSRQYIGLFPKGGAAGFYAGAVAPVAADLAPSASDCGYGAAAAYRVSLTEAQYRRLLAKVRSTLASPPKWRMFGFNCNNFAASLGQVAGLREPKNRDLPSFSYIHAYIKANGDG